MAHLGSMLQENNKLELLYILRDAHFILRLATIFDMVTSLPTVVTVVLAWVVR